MKWFLHPFIGPWQSCVKPQIFADHFYSGRKLHHVLLPNEVISFKWSDTTANHQWHQAPAIHCFRVQPAFISLPVSHRRFDRGPQTTKPFPRSSFQQPAKPSLDTTLKKAEPNPCTREIQWHCCQQYYPRHVLHTATANAEKHLSAGVNPLWHELPLQMNTSDTSVLISGLRASGQWQTVSRAVQKCCDVRTKAMLSLKQKHHESN